MMTFDRNLVISRPTGFSKGCSKNTVIFYQVIDIFVFFFNAVAQPKQLELAQNDKKHTNVEDVQNPRRLPKSNIG